MEKKTNTHDHSRQTEGSVLPQRRRRGFSLLELLAVMAIMAMLATLAVSSYFAAVKGMAARSAKRHFENALVSARQRACIDGVRVSLMAFNEGGFDSKGDIDEDKLIACYVICKEIGRLSWVSDNYLYDEFSDLKALFGEKVTDASDAMRVSSSYTGGFRLYNLSQGSWTFVEPNVTLKKLGEGNSALLYTKALYDTSSTRASVVKTERTHRFTAYAFKKQTGTDSKLTGAGVWHVGDIYGVEVSPVQNLPKGFKFNELNDDTKKDVQCVTFEPDGSIRGGQVSFTIQGGKASSAERVQFTISSLGKISY